MGNRGHLAARCCLCTRVISPYSYMITMLLLLLYITMIHVHIFLPTFVRLPHCLNKTNDVVEDTERNDDIVVCRTAN